MDAHLIILAGGISSRMKRAPSQKSAVDGDFVNEAQEKSKAMIRLGVQRRPFLDYLLYNARQAGYRDVVIVVGEGDHSVRDYYGSADRENSYGGLSITYALQRIPSGRSKPLGTADALLVALRAAPEWKGRHVTVCNSDNLYSVLALSMMLASPRQGAIADYDRACLRFPPERISQFAVIRKDQEGSLVDIIEKASPAEIALARDMTGRVGVSMNLFNLGYDDIMPFLERVPLHPLRQEKELPEAVKMMVASFPGSVTALPLAEHVPDLTAQEDIVAVSNLLTEEFKEVPLPGP